jgi:hypothetical protein
MRTGRPPTPAIDRFTVKIQKLPNGCWKWIAHLDTDGYGRFYWNGNRNGFAHQFSYEYFNGPLDKALTVDHMCRNRWCVNPAHLRQITNLENVMIGVGVGAKNARKTVCPLGHTYSTENTYYDKLGYRGCKICRKMITKAHNKIHGARYAKNYREKYNIYWNHTYNCYVQRQ